MFAFVFAVVVSLCYLIYLISIFAPEVDSVLGLENGGERNRVPRTRFRLPLSLNPYGTSPRENSACHACFQAASILVRFT